MSLYAIRSQKSKNILKKWFDIRTNFWQTSILCFPFRASIAAKAWSFVWYLMKAQPAAKSKVNWQYTLEAMLIIPFIRKATSLQDVTFACLLWTSQNLQILDIPIFGKQISQLSVRNIFRKHSNEKFMFWKSWQV